ncbi:hypothetical protein [Weissella cibaria]|jgi:hypothetical protein|uniref:hypothetical protein n=1 Tax=Weissella cibaria TaxID=137591 RepID=UPI0011939723|nr:hypothetical protein [Weissella cibaria]MCS8561412.1 hypothetical protein [Weissella cibaria]MCS8565766.1 hypothetical protein [Weissella cibaria]MCS8575936.1 hypothetical protein [Weissella cibaria]MCS9988106.1 hypothetical protein [Weissella cibaria]MCS9999771.1 hypothetical protein [Weissella cibaria]
MMIMITFVVFALLIGAMGIYLLRHRTGFMGIAAAQAKMPATIFGWFFTVDAALLLISVVIYRDAPLPAGIFVILATIMTTALALTVVRRLFK